MWLFMHTQECNVQIPSLSAHKFMFQQAPLLKMLVLLKKFTIGFHTIVFFRHRRSKRTLIALYDVCRTWLWSAVPFPTVEARRVHHFELVVVLQLFY